MTLFLFHLLTHLSLALSGDLFAARVQEMVIISNTWTEWWSRSGITFIAFIKHLLTAESSKRISFVSKKVQEEGVERVRIETIKNIINFYDWNSFFNYSPTSTKSGQQSTSYLDINIVEVEAQSLSQSQ